MRRAVVHVQKSKYTNCLNDTKIIYMILSDQNREWLLGPKAGPYSFDSIEAVLNFLINYDITGKKHNSN